MKHYTAEIHEYAPELTTLYRNNVAVFKGSQNHKYIPMDNIKNIKRAYRAHNKAWNMHGFKVYQITYNYESLTNQKKLFYSMTSLLKYVQEQKKPVELICGFDADNKSIYETRVPSFKITHLQTQY